MEHRQRERWRPAADVERHVWVGGCSRQYVARDFAEWAQFLDRALECGVDVAEIALVHVPVQAVQQIPAVHAEAS